jgi:hypothetical protein
MPLPELGQSSFAPRLLLAGRFDKTSPQLLDRHSSASAAMTPGPRQPPQDGSQMRVVRKPNLRVRQGVRGGCVFPGCLLTGFLDNNVPLLNRLQHKVNLRNTDKNRLTSLSWAALEGSLEVFEWLLLDYGHDDQELSRVSAIQGVSS